jgi:hypothetical protein
MLDTEELGVETVSLEFSTLNSKNSRDIRSREECSED